MTTQVQSEDSFTVNIFSEHSSDESVSLQPYRNIVLLELVENNSFTTLQTWLKDPSCDVNEKDVHGNCAATLAACNNNFRILDLLCSFGAKLDVKDDSGCSPYDYAIENENEAMQQYIQQSIQQYIQT